MFLKLCQYVKDLLKIWCVEHFKTQEMCNEAVQSFPWVLEHIPDQFVTQKMCNEAVKENPWVLRLVPDQYKTQEMYNKVVEENPWVLELVPDQFVTQEMCNEAVKKSPCPLRYKRYALWYKGYEQCKAQKAKIKEELMAVAWHPDRWWNWCA